MTAAQERLLKDLNESKAFTPLENGHRRRTAQTLEAMNFVERKIGDDKLPFGSARLTKDGRQALKDAA